jgi:arsenate reductase
MAEGLLRALYGDINEAYSAGIVASQVNPLAVKVMNEIGIDISGQRSKDVGEYQGATFDLVVTVCDEALEMCPAIRVSPKTSNDLIAKKIIHKTFKDPSVAEGSKDGQLVVFRQVRDEIKDWIVQNFGIHGNNH